MQGPRRKGAGPSVGPEGPERGAAGSAKSGANTSAMRMAAALGNDELQRRIEKGNATRDELLVYMNQRLGNIREAQLRERQQGSEHMREHWKDIADIHKQEFSKPEPLRWHESARLYEQAAYQLCRGAMGRGAELLEKAMEAERRAFEAVGQQVATKDLEPGAEGCEALGDVAEHQACAPRDVPSDLQAKADEIQRESTEFKDQPVKRRVPDPWWTLEEEEEEEAKPADGG